MAGSKLNTYGVGDVNLTNVMEVLDASRRGLHKVSLTEWTTTTKPEITAGSIIEINGALFEFESDEAISGTPSDGYVYIKLTPSGDSVTADFSNTAPAWDDEKQGWYESGTNNRYVNFFMYKAASLYKDKKQVENICTDTFGKSLSEPDTYSYISASVYYPVSIASTGSKTYKYFIVKKPISCLVKCEAGSNYYSSVMLNPGYYRLWAYKTGETYGVDLQYTSGFYVNVGTYTSDSANQTAKLAACGVYGCQTIDQMSFDTFGTAYIEVIP